MQDSLNILAWADLVDTKALARFQQDTGIKVNVSYFENNESLLAKLKATQGQGYDLLMPSDYMVELLVKEKLLKPIDYQKLDFVNRLDSRLLGHYYDPDNRYSIPYHWSVYGFGFNRDLVGPQENVSWSVLFDTSLSRGKVAMVNVAREALLIGGFYLYHVLAPYAVDQLEKIKDLLVKQKNFVEAYTDYRADYLLVNKACSFVLTSSATMWRSMQENPALDFAVPDQGTFWVIDTMAVSCASQKDRQIYMLLNYLYQENVLRSQFFSHALFPATTDLKDLLTSSGVSSSLRRAHSGDITNYHFFLNILSEAQIDDVWISLKSR